MHHTHLTDSLPSLEDHCLTLSNFDYHKMAAEALNWVLRSNGNGAGLTNTDTEIFPARPTCPAAASKPGRSSQCLLAKKY